MPGNVRFRFTPHSLFEKTIRYLFVVVLLGVAKKSEALTLCEKGNASEQANMAHSPRNRSQKPTFRIRVCNTMLFRA